MKKILLVMMCLMMATMICACNIKQSQNQGTIITKENGRKYKQIKAKDASVEDLAGYCRDNEKACFKLEDFKKIPSVKKTTTFKCPFFDEIGQLNRVLKVFEENMPGYKKDYTMEYITVLAFNEKGLRVYMINNIDKKIVEHELNEWKVLQLDDMIEIRLREEQEG